MISPQRAPTAPTGTKLRILVQTAAEAAYERLAMEHERTGSKKPFDHLAAASKALNEATRELTVVG